MSILKEKKKIFHPSYYNQSQPFWRDGEVCGNCNGLLFMYRGIQYPYHKYTFALWNPSTRQYKDLSYCPLEAPINVRFHATGLGYDDSTDDYKAILRVHVNGGTGVEVQVWIYWLKSNMWRRVPNFPYIEYSVSEGRIGYYSDGSLHWVRTLVISGVRRKEIVAFDLRKETFSLMPQPPICLINSVVIVSPKLHVLEGSLCVSYLFTSMPARVDFFIRKKDGIEKFSWTKLLSLSESLPSEICWLYNLKILGYSKRSGDEILIDVGGNRNMVLYDLKEKTFRKVEIDKDGNWEPPFLCLESLVSVGIGA